MYAPQPSPVVHANGPRPGPRELVRELADVAVALPLFAAAPLLRGWHTHWGATTEEMAAEMPGDRLIPGCQYIATRAVSIDAPPHAVWPWLVQAGFGKAGFYSNDLLDNVGHPSANRILDEFQHPQVGDWVPMFGHVNDTTAFKVEAIEPFERLLWKKPDSTWAWTLKAVGTGTRLVTRLRARYDWNAPTDAVLSVVLNEFADFAMMRKMLLSIKQRAETSVE